MIISRWKGFEIDSSEGYYAFSSDATDIEERWSLLDKLLNSPLLWNKAAFDITGKNKESSEIIRSYLSDLEKKGEVENTEKKYHYCPYVYAAPPLILLAVLNRFREQVESVWANFCIRPLDSMDRDVFSWLESWYLSQFTKKKEGQSRWRDYNKIEDRDLTLAGNQDYTDSWDPVYAFEASLQFYPNTERGLSIYMCAGDPSLIIYLISSIFRVYDLEYNGDHYISIDRRPDRLRKSLERD
ncbi:MAG: hypothetical protein MUP70_16630 [Candidatus Aminicenantes bacterium]|nr:hypothetical protein [Candidatus Aminicenantes bacterium]